MPQTPNATLLFHISDTLTDRITPSGNRPKFYWFNDSYHDHYNFGVPGMAYLYFFLVKPGSTKAKLFTRHGAGDFQSMWSDYVTYLQRREANEQAGAQEYLEPGIVLSFSEMVPDVVCRFVDGFKVAARKNDRSDETTFDLRADGMFRHFNEIPELLELLPGLVNAAPIARPDSGEIKTPKSFWPADSANQGRMWL